MKIAVEGCAHGELEKIYETIQIIEKDTDIKVDLLLCCGDFQATRNIDDLQTMAVPKKFHNMGSFYKYYSGELVAPILTIFVGGNHEASNYLQELPYGGWVAPNIYYLGYAGVVRVNGLRIAGLSGIYKGYDYLKGRFEYPPYDESTKTSVYHIRQLEAFRLKQLSGKIDICLSHDWPRGIWQFGNREQLLRFKPHFRDDIEKNELGSRPCEEILYEMQPTYWFAAHLHCKFAAIVPHKTYAKTRFSENDGEKMTKFLALDKCLPKRRFLQILAIDPPDNYEEGVIKFEYDLEWLTILSITNHLTNVKPSKYYLPSAANDDINDRYNFTPTPDELKQVSSKLKDLTIPKNFCKTVAAYDGFASFRHIPNIPQPKAVINPQNKTFCDRLGIDDPLTLAILMNGDKSQMPITLTETSTANDEAIELGGSDTSSKSASQTPEPSPLKRKSLLTLPKPTCDEILEELFPDSKNTSETSEANELTGESAIDGDTNPDSGDNSPVKKLKRRNLLMYDSKYEQNSSDNK